MAASSRIVHVDLFHLQVPMLADFAIATARLQTVDNVAIAVTLADGTVGWGEAPTLPPVTREDFSSAMLVATSQVSWLVGRDVRAWRRLARELFERIPDDTSVRAGFEMALIDSLTRQAGLPLYLWFGGCEDHLVTDITIPICPDAEAEHLARDYRLRGFQVIKVKTGRDVDTDIGRLLAIRRGHPECRLVVDANGAYTVDEALEFLASLRARGVDLALFEQPVARRDWDGLGRLAREAGVPVAADESCRSPTDAIRIVRNSLAQVLNVKLAKCGVAQALDIATIARASGIGLMIGGMVETRLAMGFSAHFAAGLGGFSWVDLDTPLLMAVDPVKGGCAIDGPHYRLDGSVSGHGGALERRSSRPCGQPSG